MNAARHKRLLVRHWTIVNGEKVEFPPVKIHLFKNGTVRRKASVASRLR
jgi:hypothetical protein